MPTSMQKNPEWWFEGEDLVGGAFVGLPQSTPGAMESVSRIVDIVQRPSC